MALHAVPITLGGRELALRFRFRAWVALEDHGHHLFSITRQFQSEQPSFSAIRLLLWAMLRHENPAPTLDQVTEWLDQTEDEATIIEKIGEAMRLGLPDRAPGENGRPLGATADSIGPSPVASPSVPSV